MHAPKKELNLIAQALFDKKGFNILALDVKGVSSLTDYVIIAEGNIDRHIRALAIAVQDKLHEIGHDPLYKEGINTGDWVILDYSNIVVHLLTPELRQKYELEQLWRKGSIFKVDINVKSTSNGEEAEW